MKKSIFVMLTAVLLLFTSCVALEDLVLPSAPGPRESSRATPERDESESEEVKEEVEEEIEEEKKEESQEESKEEKPATPREAIDSLGDNIYQTRIKYEGAIYQFPMKYSDFLEEGWVYSGDEDVLMPSLSRSGVARFKNGKNSGYAVIGNFDINEKPVKDCYILGMDFDFMYLEEGAKVETLGDIRLMESTEEDVIAALGTPSSDYKGDSGSSSLTYTKDHSITIVFRFFESENGVLTSIDMENTQVPEDFEIGAISGETPELVSNYKTPQELSGTLEDFIVEYGGAMYQLPAPVSAFIQEGWKLEDASKEAALPGLGWDRVTLSYDNQELRATIRNYDENATTLENCFITEVKTDAWKTRVSLVISGGITTGMKETEVDKILNGMAIEYEKEDRGVYTYYTIEYDSFNNSYEIKVENESGKVETISVSHEPKRDELKKFYK